MKNKPIHSILPALGLLLLVPATSRLAAWILATLLSEPYMAMAMDLKVSPGLTS